MNTWFTSDIYCVHIAVPVSLMSLFWVLFSQDHKAKSWLSLLAALVTLPFTVYPSVFSRYQWIIVVLCYLLTSFISFAKAIINTNKG